MTEPLWDELDVVDKVMEIADQVFADILSLDDAKTAIAAIIPHAQENELQPLQVIAEQEDRRAFVFEAYGWVWIRN